MQSSISYELTLISAILLSVVAILVLISKICSKNDAIVTNETWGCGFNNLDSTMQYSGNGFSQPMTRLFSGVVGYSKRVHVASHIDLRDDVFDVIERYLYRPVILSINTVSKIVVQIHSGKVQSYVMYIFVTLFITLLLVHILI